MADAGADATGVDCILGSGPAGVACASELLGRGRKVVLVDPGRRLPVEHSALVEDFRRSPDRKRLLKRLRGLRRDLPPALQEEKLPFSSSYLYDDLDRHLPAEMENAKVLRSLASGGLSAVWGATVTPMARESFRNWPINREELEPFYRKAAGLIDVPVVEDDLTPHYPNYGNGAPTALSEQGAQLMANLLNNRSVLAGDGIIFGRSRSAIGARYAADGSGGCVYCGLCMYGCPYNAIFNAEHVVDRLKSNPRLVHHTGRIAVGFKENVANVEVRLRRLDTRTPETLVCDRLFVACGAASSLQLIISAQKMFDRLFYIKDTQLISIPIFLRRRCRPGAIPKANALGQVMIVLHQHDLCDEAIHLQIYGFNPFITDLLRARWGSFFIGERLLQPLFNQMMVIMAYLPSQLSGRIAAKVRPSSSALELGLASFTGEVNPRSREAVHLIGRKLTKHRRALGAWPALALTHAAVPGFSNHLGACLPMREKPQPGETDRFGRPYGLRRVHVVDSAAFSDLPAEHLTYTIMANAMRIAEQARCGDPP